MPNHERIRIGIVGQGGMGARHAANVERYVGAAQVVAVYDPDAGRAREGAARCAAARVFADPDALIESDEVDAVIVASPDPTHVGFVLTCLRQGKPVLCEKPLALDVAQAEQVVAAETALGRRLVALGFMRRFDPQHLAVQRLVQSGAIGRPVLYKGVHRNASDMLRFQSDQIILNSASHDLDAARWLLAREITGVYVRAIRTRAEFSADSQDLVVLQLDFGADCLATVEVFVAADYGYEVAAEIVGQRGSAVTGQPAPALLRAAAARSVAVDGDWLLRFQEAYVAEAVHWVESLRAGVTWPGASAWDGYAALVAGGACCESLRLGAPVPVPDLSPPALYAAR